MAAGVPHPCDGRCWKRPSRSRSPRERLCRPDSCNAAANAIVTAWSGRPRRLPLTAIVVALAACSPSSGTDVAPTVA